MFVGGLEKDGSESARGFRSAVNVDTSFNRLIGVLILGLNSWTEIASEPVRH